MPRAYSLDLRERVVAAVAAGESCRKAAAAFRVSVASVVKWSQRYRATGSAPAKPVGNRRGSSWAVHRDWLLARREAVPDLTLRALVAELGDLGVVTSDGSVWRGVHAADITFKKTRICPNVCVSDAEGIALSGLSALRPESGRRTRSQTGPSRRSI